MTFAEVRDMWIDKLIDMGVDLEPKKLIKWAKENPSITSQISRDFMNAVPEEEEDERLGTEELGSCLHS